MKIDQTIINLKSQGQDNHWQWLEARNAKVIANILYPEKKAKIS